MEDSSVWSGGLRALLLFPLGALLLAVAEPTPSLCRNAMEHAKSWGKRGSVTLRALEAEKTRAF